MTENQLKQDWKYPKWLLTLTSQSFNSFNEAIDANPYNDSDRVYWMKEYSHLKFDLEKYTATVRFVDGVYRWVID